MAAVIIGGGVIGLSIAYYISLAEPGRKIYVVDSESSLLLSASGFSGGFIPLDWFSSEVLSLASLSFRLHRQLADAHNGRHLWGYTQSTAFSLVRQDLNASGQKTGKQIRGEDWLLHGTSRADVARQYASASSAKGQKVWERQDHLLNGDGSPKWFTKQPESDLEKISSDSGCAQVEPRELCKFLLQKCMERGVIFLLNSKATSLMKKNDGKIEKIRISSCVPGGVSKKITDLCCKDIIISAGCWTPDVFQSLFKQNMAIGIKPLAGYSIVIRSPKYTRPIIWINDNGEDVEMAHSIFCPPSSKWTYSPEAMARLGENGKPEIYVAGLNSDKIPLPELASGSKQLMDPMQMDDLKRTAIAITGRSNTGGIEEADLDLEVVREGLCFRPASSTGLPIISKIDGLETVSGGGAYVASGHGP